MREGKTSINGEYPSFIYMYFYRVREKRTIIQMDFKNYNFTIDLKCTLSVMILLLGK